MPAFDAATLRLAFWAGLALVLFAAEALVPGASLMWLGFAATAMVLVMLVAPGLEVLPQAALFAVFAIASVLVYRRWFRARAQISDKPLLNRRAEQLVGQTAVLEQPIVRGHGRIQLADTYWSVAGPDLPAGAAVRVVSTDGMTLQVEAA
ncbi:NfeD family protein [Pseudoxanthomonas winnipegensis]|uniref:NfeD family protein n=1 Tax=Pseudoxanthomonas winnipegensis TaxID=2480810 RepID=A0ABY1WD83_9GAMM|nr:NfeD family protein [Pseudoxanthomonas winnipegensis]TAA12299.1 NfeD family protein [Pseudoxanthomonas winnipegensis]TAA19336.1 NfeD family protein [Pseudoxanthomonas winnipegensis]TAH70596.1 NfeD family protein [Pseudoxanthomonas winnipegensis]